MLLRLLLMFTIIPLVELFILIKLSSMFGLLSTIFVVIGTGAVGAYQTKKQGLAVMHKIREEMKYGRFPKDQLIEGFLLLVAGIVLITPGLLTDMAGLILLFPITRSRIKDFVKKKTQQFQKKSTMHIEV